MQKSALLETLKNDYLDLREEWDLYKNIFAKSTERIELLNVASAHFFHDIQRVIIKNVILGTSRITEKDVVAGKKTLTLTALLVEATKDKWKCLAKLNALHDEILNDVKQQRKVRNRILAHREKKTAFNASRIPKVNFEEIDDSITKIGEYLNIANLEINSSQNSYIVSGNPYGNDVIECLKRSEHYSSLIPDYRARKVEREKWKYIGA